MSLCYGLSVFVCQGNLLSDETGQGALQFELRRQNETYPSRYLVIVASIVNGYEGVTDFARILYSHPSIKLGKLMFQPPGSHQPKLTLIMV